ncbi:hypothetical protein ACOSQ4_027522 [Xanthoceras sorbifolium]
MQFPSMSPYPVGVRFHPTNTELVGIYLYNKIVAPILLSGNNWIRDCDLYGLQEPSDIWRLFGGDDGLTANDRALYFFTKLKKKSSNGYRICRRVASGTWAGEDSGEKIEASNVFGFKKRFRKHPRTEQVDYLLMQQNQQAEDFQKLTGRSDSSNMAANHLFSSGLQVPLLLDCSDNVAESSYSSSARLSDSGYKDHLLLDSSVMPVEIKETAIESSSTVVVAVPITTEPSLFENDRYINLDGQEIVIENGVGQSGSIKSTWYC